MKVGSDKSFSPDEALKHGTEVTACQTAGINFDATKRAWNDVFAQNLYRQKTRHEKTGPMIQPH